jgi:hypothetical protein
VGKSWYQSRTIITNAIVILSAFGAWAAMGFDKEIGMVTILPTLVSCWNVYLRMGTTEPIKPITPDDG